MNKKYYEYEVIDYLYGYIKDNYNGANLLEEKTIELENFIQNDFSSKNKNCSLVAITRIIKYYSANIDIIPKNEQEIFSQVFNIALSYGFNEITGTHPTKIDNIISDYFNEYNIKVESKGHYFPNFYNPLKSEIDNNRPLVMNIAFGKYSNHSVTITGYKIFKYKGMKIKFIELFDGWTKKHSYIDYNVFAHSLFSVNVYSLNSLKILD